MKNSFDWRVLKRYTSSESFNDLNNFLEKLPDNVGTTLLSIGGAAWLLAGATIMFANIESIKVQELQAELYKKQALTPNVPTVTTQQVSTEQIEAFVARLQKQFERFDITINVDRDGSVLIQGREGRQYGAFREAVGHLQNGGSDWRVNVKEVCVDRECTKGRGRGGKTFLHGKFAISKIRVDLNG